MAEVGAFLQDHPSSVRSLQPSGRKPTSTPYTLLARVGEAAVKPPVEDPPSRQIRPSTCSGKGLQGRDQFSPPLETKRGPLVNRLPRLRSHLRCPRLSKSGRPRRHRPARSAAEPAGDWRPARATKMEIKGAASGHARLCRPAWSEAGWRSGGLLNTAQGQRKAHSRPID